MSWCPYCNRNGVDKNHTCHEWHRSKVLVKMKTKKISKLLYRYIIIYRIGYEGKTKTEILITESISEAIKNFCINNADKWKTIISITCID